MDKNQVLKAIKELREKSPKKKFLQTVDLIINLKNLDLKKQEHKVDIYMKLPNSKGKKPRICAFVDAQLAPKAKDVFDTVIQKSEFDKWKNNKKNQKLLSNTHDFFVAQADMMAQVAAIFGKVLGARGKMPNPKAGCVIPATANPEPVVANLQNTIRLQTKNDLSIKAVIGNESSKDDELADNILSIYNTLIPKLHQEKDNLRSIMIKLTMGPRFRIEEEVKKEK